MTLEELGELQNALKITRIIGLGEAQRELYHQLFDSGEHELVDAYHLHEKELEALIKYQESRNSEVNKDER